MSKLWGVTKRLSAPACLGSGPRPTSLECMKLLGGRGTTPQKADTPGGSKPFVNRPCRATRRALAASALLVSTSLVAACSGSPAAPPATSAPAAADEATPPSSAAAPTPSAETQETAYLGQPFKTAGGMKCRVDAIDYGPGDNKQQESVQFTIVAWNKSGEPSGDCGTHSSFNAAGEWACPAYVYADRGLRASYPETAKCQVPKGTRFDYSLFEDTLDGALNSPSDPDSIKVILKRAPQD